MSEYTFKTRSVTRELQAGTRKICVHESKICVPAREIHAGTSEICVCTSKIYVPEV